MRQQVNIMLYRRVVKILTIGLFFIVMLSSCVKDMRPYYGYEYTKNNGEKVEFTLANIREEYGVGLLGGYVEASINGPEVIINEYTKMPCFQFKALSTDIRMYSDAPVFYEGVRYHNSAQLFVPSIPTGYDETIARFNLDKDTNNAQSGWIEFHYGADDVEFYLLYGIKYPNDLEITGSLKFYKRMIGEFHIPWRDWIRPAEENKGEKERWIEYTWDD